MAFAFLPISGSRQGRVRLYADQEGGGHLRHCHPLRIGQPCCACGEAAALVHVAGDLKRWPAMQNFLGRKDSTEGRNRASEEWWGGDFRQQRLKKHSEEKMFLMAKDQGLELLVPVGSSWCRTLRTEAGGRYRASGLGQLRGELEVQTMAREFHVLISGSNRSIEISMVGEQVVLQELGAGGAGGAVLQHACFEHPRWVSLRLAFGSQPQLELCGDKMAVPVAMLGGFSLQVASEQEAPWAICVT